MDGHCFPYLHADLKVEVLDWNGDRCPRGQYLEDSKMHSRDSDTSILEAVQILARLVSFAFFSSTRSKSGMFPEQRSPKRIRSPSILSILSQLLHSIGTPRISLNFCDWPRGDPRSELAGADFPQPMRRNQGLLCQPRACQCWGMVTDSLGARF